PGPPLFPYTTLFRSRRFLRPHAGERLVQQQHLRRGGEHHGDLELALLAVAELGGDGVGAVVEQSALERAPGGAAARRVAQRLGRSEEHTSELQSREN